MTGDVGAARIGPEQPPCIGVCLRCREPLADGAVPVGLGGVPVGIETGAQVCAALALARAEGGGSGSHRDAQLPHILVRAELH